MKKIFLNLFLSILILSPAVFAEENQDYNQILNSTQMPSDEEIMETIQKYNFDKSQQEFLFKETKKRLENLYNNKNYEPLVKNEINNIEETKNNIEETKETQTEKEVKNQTVDVDTSNMQNVNNIMEKQRKEERAKKYTNHPPLTRKNER